MGAAAEVKHDLDEVGLLGVLPHTLADVFRDNCIQL
jgi:hypothetical protein